MNNIKIIQDFLKSKKDLKPHTEGIMHQVKYFSDEEFAFLMTHTPGKQMVYEFFIDYVDKIDSKEEYEDLEENIKFIFRSRENWNKDSKWEIDDE